MNSSDLIIKKIVDFRNKKFWYFFTANLLNFIVYLIVIWLSTIVADSTFHFLSSTRWLILILNSLLSLFFLYRTLLNPMVGYFSSQGKRNLTPITKEIGDLFPEIRDKLTNIYQLATDKKMVGLSSSLKKYAIDRFAKLIRNIDFRSPLNYKKYLLPIPAMILIFVSSILLVAFMPKPLFLSSKRIFNPVGQYHEVPNYNFSIQPGNSNIILGQTLSINAKYEGPELRYCRLIYRENDETPEKEKRMSFKEGSYYADIENIRESFEYKIQAIPEHSAVWSNELWSQNFQVQVLIPPIITEVQIAVSPPSHTGLQKQYLEPNVGDILAYAGSRVEISAQTNKNIQEAAIIFSDSSRISLESRGQKLISSFVIGTGQSYQFQLTDEQNIKNQNPIEYSINVIEDSYPMIAIIEPGADISLAPDAVLNLLMEGKDDFGFSKLNLNYQIISSLESVQDTTWNSFPIMLRPEDKNYFQLGYIWNFATVAVGFEDAIKYYVSLTDNDLVNGPKLSHSKIYTINFPSLEQIFAEFDTQQQETSDELEGLKKEGEELNKSLEEITRELKRDKNMDWERKQQLESTLNRQKNIQEKLKKIQNDLEKAVKKLQENQLFSPEVFEKYQQLQQLFQEISTPELVKAMENLRNSLEEVNMNQAQKKLQEFKLNQDQFQARLERTIELFERVKVEQEIDRLVKVANEMFQEQEKITNSLKEKKQIEKNELLKAKQESQKKSLEDIENTLNTVMKEEILQDYPETQSNLNSANDLIDQEQMNERLNDLKNMLSENKQQSAYNDSRSITKDMEKLHSFLQEAQNKMLESSQRNVMAKMLNAGENLLKLSNDEENLMMNTKDLSNFSDKFNDLAKNQQNVSENMNRVINDIINLSKETFFITPEMSKFLGNAKENMRKSVGELENRNQTRASNNQRQAMAALNEAVVNIQSSMQDMANSNSALGFDQFLKSMQKLSAQQGQLNQEGLNFFNGQGNQESLSLQQRSELQRMAAQQRAIENALKQLNEEVDNRSDVLGDMNNLAKEMEEVVKDLQTLRIDRETIERQNKILSRMLDAQKSIHDREYSRQRKAEVGKEYVRKSPSEILDPVDEQLEKLQLYLLRALKEGYNPDYEKLIEDYFRRLNNKSLRELFKITVLPVFRISKIYCLLVITYLILGSCINVYGRSIYTQKHPALYSYVTHRHHNDQSTRKRLGLVLSGGGARGISHIGVLRKLEAYNLPIDLIVGTSMGSVIGGFYAAGLSTDKLEKMIRNIDWNSIYRDETDRENLFIDQKVEQDRYLLNIRFDGFKAYLPTSFTSGQKILSIITNELYLTNYQAVYNFDNLKIPFRAIATDLISGNRMVIGDGPLAEAIYASTAVPLLFSPVVKNGMLLVDGGLSSNFAVDAARALGMDAVIVVDITSPLRNSKELQAPWEIADQVTTIMMQSTNAEQIQMADIIIKPRLEGIGSTDFDKIDSMIEEGEKAVDQVIKQIKSLLKKDIQESAPKIYNFTSCIHKIFDLGMKMSLVESRSTNSIKTCKISHIKDDVDELFMEGSYNKIEASIDTTKIDSILIYSLYRNGQLKNIQILGNTKFIDSLIISQISHSLAQPLNYKIIKDDLIAIENLYKSNGYALMKLKRINFNDSTGLLTVEIDEGSVDKIEIEGNNQTNKFVILREFPLKEKQVFTTHLVKSGIENIYNTQLFEKVSVNVIPIATNNQHTLLIKVEEKKFTVLRLGGKVGSERGAQGYLEFGNENVFGMGNKLSLLGRFGVRDNTLSLNFRTDRIFKTFITIGFNTYWDFKINPYLRANKKIGEYKEERFGGKVIFGQQLQKLGQMSIELRLENVKDKLNSGSFDNEQNSELRTITIRSLTDRRDNIAFTNEGIYNNWYWESGNESFLKGQEKFTKVFVNLEAFYTYWIKHTFHIRGVIGIADKTLPFSEYFRIGGLGSFMGLHDFEYSGKQVIFANLEYRYKIPQKIIWDTYLGFRYDIGGIWETPDLVLKSEDFFNGMGAWIGWDTILGPLIFGYGNASLREGIFYASLGYNF